MPFWLLSSNAHYKAGEDLPVPEKCSTSSTLVILKYHTQMTTPTPGNQDTSFLITSQVIYTP